jgi:predicted Zn-dependent protease with MMP-like domain
MMRMNREEFERVVSRALDGLPDEIASRLENIAIVVEDEPTQQDLVDVGLDPETDTLFGIYHGLALPDRGGSYGNVLPDRIVIYRRPLLAVCQDRNELIRQIQDTVVHEVGHYFGLAEDDLP